MRRSSPAIALSLAATVLALGGAVAWLLRDRGGAGAASGLERGAAASDADARADLEATRAGDPLAAGASTRGAPPSGSGTLAGRVLALDDDAPIAGACVELHPESTAEGPPLATATTGADGAFRFDDLEPRSAAIVIARADGFASALVTERNDPVRANATMTLDPIRLEAAAVVAGRTLDVEGRPLAGVRVSVILMGDPPVESDAEGRFTLRRVPMRPFHVQAELAGYVAVPDGWIVFVPRSRAANPELLFKLAPAGTLRGRVRTRHGRAVPEASVGVAIEQPLSLRASASVDHCDPDGRFEFDALPTGAIASVVAESVWFAESAAVPVQVGTGDVDVVVEPWPLLPLEIVDAESGARLEPDQVRVVVMDPRTGPLPESGSDSHDPFEDVEWRKSDRGWTPRALPDGRIGVPFGRAIVILAEKLRQEENPYDPDHPNAPLPPLRHVEWQCEVAAGAVGHVEGKAAFVVATGAAPPAVRIALERGGAVAGRVVDTAGAPVAGALVHLMGVLPDDTRGTSLWNGVVVPDDHRRWLEAKSDAEGRFDIPLDFAERRPAIVRVHAHGFAPTQTDPFELVPHGRVEREIVLLRGGVLEGRVVRGGVAQRNRVVVAFRPDGIADVERCDGDGRYRFAALPAGRYRVRLGGPGAADVDGATWSREGAPPRPPPARSDVEIADGATVRFDLDLDAPPGQGIRGVVHMPRAERRGLRVTAKAVDVVADDPRFDAGGHVGSLDDDGAYFVPDLETGRWSVEVAGWGGAMPLAHAEAVVRDGGWTTVDLEIRRSSLRGRIFDRATGTPLVVNGTLRRGGTEEENGTVCGLWSGPGGVFCFEGLAPDKYRLSVPGESILAIASVVVDLREADVLDLEVAVDAQGAFVVDKKTLAEKGFELTFATLERKSSAVNLLPRVDDSRLVFGGLLPDDYSLVVDWKSADGACHRKRCYVWFSLGRTNDVTDEVARMLGSDSE